MPPTISPKPSPEVGKIWNIRAVAGLKVKLLCKPKNAADTTKPIMMAMLNPPATVAAKVNTLRLYLIALAKKKAEAEEAARAAAEAAAAEKAAKEAEAAAEQAAAEAPAENPEA